MYKENEQKKIMAELKERAKSAAKEMEADAEIDPASKIIIQALMDQFLSSALEVVAGALELREATIANRVPILTDKHRSDAKAILAKLAMDNEDDGGHTSLHLALVRAYRSCCEFAVQQLKGLDDGMQNSLR